MKIEETVRAIIGEEIEKDGYVLDEVLYEKKGNNGTLTIIIDKNGGIDIDDCIKVTKTINPLLDKEDPIKESYVLDVCSKMKGSE